MGLVAIYNRGVRRGTGHYTPGMYCIHLTGLEDFEVLKVLQLENVLVLLCLFRDHETVSGMVHEARERLRFINHVGLKCLESLASHKVKRRWRWRC